MPDTPEPTWPTFTVPEGSGIPAEPATPADAGTPPAAPPASAAPSSPPAASAATAPAGETTPPDEMFPKYRYDAVRTENERLQAQLGQLTQLLTAVAPLLQKQPPGAPPPAPDPVRDKIVAQLYEYVPWLRQAERLAPLADRIEAALQQIDELRQKQAQSVQETQASWDQYARHVVAAAHAAVAPLLVPPGKTVRDLSEFTKQTITDLFIRWVAADQSRATRYNAHDGALVNEFKTFYEAEMVTPFKRESAASLAARARAVGTLPTGGQTSSTLGTPPPSPKPDDDEDAIFKRGWAMTQDMQKAGAP